MFWDLLDIATGIILDDSMSISLQNSISVNIALAMSVVSNATISVNTIQEDVSGNKQVVYDDSSNYLLARKLWLTTIHTIKRCEEKYNSYIIGRLSLELKWSMLYYTSDSVINSNNNIIELLRMQHLYSM